MTRSFRMGSDPAKHELSWGLSLTKSAATSSPSGISTWQRRRSFKERSPKKTTLCTSGQESSQLVQLPNPFAEGPHSPLAEKQEMSKCLSMTVEAHRRGKNDGGQGIDLRRSRRPAKPPSKRLCHGSAPEFGA